MTTYEIKNEEVFDVYFSSVYTYFIFPGDGTMRVPVPVEVQDAVDQVDAGRCQSGGAPDGSFEACCLPVGWTLRQECGEVERVVWRHCELSDGGTLVCEDCAAIAADDGQWFP